MSDEITRMKEELRLLDGRIQAERNSEVHHGLQRSRLEAERAQLLVRMIEMIKQPIEFHPLEPYKVTLQSAPSTLPPIVEPVTAKTTMTVLRRAKPDGLPTLNDMIFAVLDGSDALAPKEITARIRQRWWPDVANDRVNTVVWRLRRDGRLGYSDGRYRLDRLNGHASS
jgi:hypothetical protein